ncbi:MAG: hypothetical protein D4R84_06320 [Rhodocyclaceae bacterium]|nr:MAG: hypothetical protein D4R84_06320 [Rhodocyclaceae bacterium]
MSLLMDALKKAELAKRRGQSEVADGSTAVDAQGGLELEPMAGTDGSDSVSSTPAAEGATTVGNLPNLPSHLEEIEAQFLAEAEQAAASRLRTMPSTPAVAPLTFAEQIATADAPSRTTAAAEPRHAQPAQGTPQSRSAAQNVFAAKQVDKPPARKGFAIAVGAITVLSVLGIGGYFWWQLQPKSAPTASRAPLSPPAVTVLTPAAVPPAPAPAESPIAGAAGAASPATPVPADKADDSARAAGKASAQARRANSAAAPTDPDSPVHITKVPLRVDPSLSRGFDAFNRGDLASAQIEYGEAYRSDPRNTDAMHGLAAIAVRQGRFDDADALYRQITEADPQDTVAMSALINSRGQIDPGVAESRLKSLSAAQPELAAPHFSLGNLYARHGRWSDAQQSYFRAYSAEPENPDILYNLAISLEHLRQNKLAAQYYSQAIAAAQTRPAGFDKGKATARLNALQP